MPLDKIDLSDIYIRFKIMNLDLMFIEMLCIKNITLLYKTCIDLGNYLWMDKI